MFLKQTLFFLLLTFIVTSSELNTRTLHRKVDEPFCGQDGQLTDYYFCDGCFNSIYCFRLPTGQWFPPENFTCNSGETCIKATGQCSFDESDEDCIPEVKYDYECLLPGLFPNSIDCSKYHLCLKNAETGQINPAPINLECDNEFGYDSLTTQCRKKRNECQLPPVCNRVGDMFPNNDNPYMFYLCLYILIEGENILLPRALYCNIGEEFIKGSCRDPTPPSGIEGGKCLREGNFYDPTNCLKYFECGELEADAENKDCDIGTKFDPWEETCLPIKC